MDSCTVHQSSLGPRIQVRLVDWWRTSRSHWFMLERQHWGGQSSAICAGHRVCTQRTQRTYECLTQQSQTSNTAPIQQYRHAMQCTSVKEGQMCTNWQPTEQWFCETKGLERRSHRFVSQLASNITVTEYNCVCIWNKKLFLNIYIYTLYIYININNTFRAPTK